MDGPPSLRLGVRPPPGQRISYDATSDVQMQVHLHRRKAELATLPAQRRPGNCQFQLINAGKTPLVGWRPAAERDEPWIWCPATCCPHSYGPRNGGRVVTAIPAVTASKWPGCPESR